MIINIDLFSEQYNMDLNYGLNMKLFKTDYLV